MSKFNTLSQAAVVAAVIVGLTAGVRPALADETSAFSWFAAKQEALSQALDAKLPITFKFIGNRAMPVFINALPKFRFIAIQADANANTSGASVQRAMR